MPYNIHLTQLALDEIDHFLSYLADYDPKISARYEDMLEQIIERDLSEYPLLYPWFWIAGPPFRGRLFDVSKRTKFWIIYTCDEKQKRVDILRFWNASRNPTKLEL